MTAVAAGGRALAAVLEPVVGSVYFAPESHEAFEALGHEPSGGHAPEGWLSDHYGANVQLPAFNSYLANRAALLGAAPGEVVTAIFGVFCPELIVPGVDRSYEIADVGTVRETRDRTAVAQLKRILGEHPDGLERVNELLLRAGSRLPIAGKPLYAGVLALGLPDEPMLRMWRLAERLREFRGDCFVAAFTTHGFDGAEIQLLSERVAGDPPRSYARIRGWSEDDLDGVERRLTERGLLQDGDAVTAAGAEAREQVEQTVDRMCAPIEDALGDDLPELVGVLQGWGDELRANGGYYASGPPEEIVQPEVQEWLDAHGFHRLGEQPVR